MVGPAEDTLRAKNGGRGQASRWARGEEEHLSVGRARNKTLFAPCTNVVLFVISQYAVLRS